MTSQKEILEVIKNLPGSWRLPISKNDSATITFMPDGRFSYTISANSTGKKAIQLLLGADKLGNWHVRSEREKSSLSSSSSSFSSFRSTHKKDDLEKGPFLVLNFRKLPESILNISAFGFRLELANFMNDFLELARDGHYKIIDYSSDKITLETPKKERQVWYKV